MPVRGLPITLHAATTLWTRVSRNMPPPVTAKLSSTVIFRITNQGYGSTVVFSWQSDDDFTTRVREFAPQLLLGDGTGELFRIGRLERESTSGRRTTDEVTLGEVAPKVAE